MYRTASCGYGTVSTGPQRAIELLDLGKVYKLYESIGDQIWALTRFDRFRFWKKARYTTFQALESITLDVKYGERVGIVGRNGAGKTTLLKILTGSIAPTSGSVMVSGPVQALMQVGLGFHPDFTGYENIRSSLVYNGLKGKDTEKAVAEIVEFVELGDFLHQPFKTYSLGMRSRLQFATATAIRPDILVIDEVLGAGDAYFSAKSADRIKRLTDSGCTLLLVSHGMQQILQFCDRVVWLDAGEVVMDGPALEVVNAYEEFIHSVLNQIGSVNPEDRGTNSALPGWMRDKLIEEVLGRHAGRGGAEGARWGGEGPLRVKNMRVISRGGASLEHAMSGQSFGIAIDIESERAGSFSMASAVVIYDENGQIVSRLVDEERDRVFGPDEMHTDIVWLDDPILGAGNYTFSASLHADWNPMVPLSSTTYDIYGRAARLTIIDPTYNPARVHLSSIWEAESHHAPLAPMKTIQKPDLPPENSSLMREKIS